MKIKHLKHKLLGTGIYVLCIIISWIVDIPCLYREYFGFVCPGCGMTRALFSALQLDFVSAFNYHPMFWSVPVVFLFLYLDGGVFKNKKANHIILGLIGVGFLINWVKNLLCM